MTPPCPDHGLVRGVRAGVLTVPAVGTAGTAHLLVDGCAPLLGTFLAVGLVWPAAVALLGSRRGVGAFLGWVIAAQFATHLCLELTCPSVASARTTFAAHLIGSADGKALLVHAVAALVTAVALGRADAGLWCARALVRLASRLRLRALRPVRAPGLLRQVTAAAATLRSLSHVRLPTGRGPPAQTSS